MARFSLWVLFVVAAAVAAGTRAAMHPEDWYPFARSAFGLFLTWCLLWGWRRQSAFWLGSFGTGAVAIVAASHRPYIVNSAFEWLCTQLLESRIEEDPMLLEVLNIEWTIVLSLCGGLAAAVLQQRQANAKSQANAEILEVRRPRTVSTSGVIWCAVLSAVLLVWWLDHRHLDTYRQLVNQAAIAAVDENAADVRRLRMENLELRRDLAALRANENEAAANASAPE